MPKEKKDIKEKKEKIVYIDDGSSISDLSGFGRGTRPKKKSRRSAAHQKRKTRDKTCNVSIFVAPAWLCFSSIWHNVPDSLFSFNLI